jgi:hypothetical protein
MPLYKFKSNDVFYNRVKVNPKQSFLIYNGSAVLNNHVNESGSRAPYVQNVPDSGYVSLYEFNIDRPSNQLIYPFVYKGSNFEGFKTVTTGSFGATQYGAVVTGSYSYPLSASISKLFYSENHSSLRVRALKNTLNFYTNLSPAYQFDSSLGNKATQKLGLLSIPSILYGSSIKKGTVDLKFYITGTLVGQLKDERQNGELIQTGPTDSSESGSIAGVVLYNEGFLVLTGSWDLTAPGTAFEPSHTEDYSDEAADETPQWIYFGQSISGSITAPSSSFELSYEGTDYTQVLTMLAHAPRGELNHSNNPTYAKFNANRTYFTTGTYGYGEPRETEIKNVVSSSFLGHTASFAKTTYISEIGVYDENKNLIAIAKVAKPIKKTEERDYTFKLKLDI